MNEPLKPCHCNTTPILQHTPETGFYIHCPNCRSYTHGVQWSREEAVSTWNRRPDGWVRIDPADPETLPPIQQELYLSAINSNPRTIPKPFVLSGGRVPSMPGEKQPTYCDINGYKIPDEFMVYAYAVINRPEPAPYIRDETP